MIDVASTAGPERRGTPRGTTPYISSSFSVSLCPTMMSLAAMMKRTIPPAIRKSLIEIPRYSMILLPRRTNRRAVKNAVSKESRRFLLRLASSSLWINLMYRGRTPNTSKAIKSGINESQKSLNIALPQLSHLES